MSGGSKTQTVGYRYLFGLHMGIGRGPVDELCEIKVGDKQAWMGSVKENSTISIDAYDLFGGEEKEGGIQGTLEVMMGGPTQIAGGGLLTMLGGTLPGFRRMFTVFFDGIVTMINPYPKPWKFRLRRALQGWDGDPFEPDLAVILLPANRPPEEASLPVSFVSPPLAPPVGWTSPLSYHSNQDRVYFNGYGWYTNDPSGDEYIINYVPVPSGWVKLSDDPFDPDHMSGGAFFPAPNLAGSPTGPGYYAPPDSVTTEVPDPSELSTYIHSMNGAHIVYECLTNREWGRGLNRARLHTNSFTSAATQLKDEGFGLCLKWTRKDSIESFVQSVLDHIGAVLFPDRSTGLLKLTLIRGGYDFAAMTPFTTENGILEISEATTGSIDKAVNSVTVTYHDQITDEDRTVTVGNLANLQASGGVINSSSQDYPGVATAALASRLAQRDLRASSTTLKRFSITMDRRGYGIEPGSVIAIQDLKRGIPKTPIRVARIEEGSLTSGKVTITAVQDVFALPDTSFVSAVPPSWTPPNTKPCIDEQAAFEVPYFLLARGMSPGDLAVLDENTAFVGAFCSQGQPLNAGFKIAVRNSAPTLDDDPPDTSYNC